VVTDGQAASLPAPGVTADHDAVVIEAVKGAEDGSGDVIIRCYESLGGRAAATVTFDRPISAVRLVDLLEDERDDLPAAGLRHAPGSAEAHISLRPFQIATLRLTPA
jgi:alpha-mannosidase